MSKPILAVIAGALDRNQKRKLTPREQAIIKRWREGGVLSDGPEASEPAEPSAEMSLMEAWIQRLERDAASIPISRGR